MSDSTPPPQAVVRRSTAAMLVLWLLIMAALYALMQQYQAPRKVTVRADNTVVIARGRDGHFRAPGSVNGEAVVFLVDTGASTISVTEPLARRAGLQGGEVVRFNTANGVRSGRMVVADEVRLGSLVVHGLRVGTGLTGESDTEALLGQNFLRRFDVEIRADQMLIHPRGGHQ